MYSRKIIEQNIARVVDGMRAAGRTKFNIVRFPGDVIAEMVEHLDKLYDKEAKRFSRDLTPTEAQFIENTLILCQLDYQYWCENFAYIQPAPIEKGPAGWDELDADRDPRKQQGQGTLAKFVLNEMQLSLLAKMAQLEEACYEALARGAPVNGIMLILAKARQLGASTFWQVAGYHRLAFYHGLNGLTAGIDQTGTEAMHRRFERVHENLPPWMRPVPKYWTKDVGVTFETGSTMELQNGSQRKDLGKGETWHYFHVTEVSVFDRPEDHFDEGLFPAVPYGFVGGIPAMGGMEGTSKGKLGWWYDFVTQVMSGTAEGGAGRFDFYFAPFYLIDIGSASKGQTSKYRLEPPPDWEPSPTTVLMAEKVWQTSNQFTLSKERVRLPREVMYWYERTRLQYYKKGKLNIFRQNFPITPEESFQHTAMGAFSNETIERIDLNCSKYDPWPYKLMSEDEIPLIEQSTENPIYHVAGYHLGPMHPSELDRDPRGIVWLWEHPSANRTYVLGADPTGGIPGWRRDFRQSDDVLTDNAGIEIFRKGSPPILCEKCKGLGWIPTQQKGVNVECFECDGRGKKGGRAVQVAEFAAPVDSEECALYIFILGRVFAGNSDFEECLAVVEVNNTGIITVKALINKYGYTNLWQSQTLNSGAGAKYTSGFGFLSSATSVAVLHAKSRVVVTRRDVEVRSRFLVKEYSDAVVKIAGESTEGGALVARERFYVPPGGGRHDDRMSASFLCYWGLFRFEEMGEMELPFDQAAKDLPPARDLARTDATAAEQKDVWNQVAGALLKDQDLHFGHFPDCDITCEADHASSEALEEELDYFTDDQDLYPAW